MRLKAEQKSLLGCYEGGRYKVLREIRQGITVLKEEGDEDGMIEDLERFFIFDELKLHDTVITLMEN